MKKVLLIVCVIGCLQISCATYSYYQILSATPSTNDIALTQHNFKYIDGDCCVLYNFWSEYGNPGFSIYNNGNETIYVNLSESFFVINDVAHDYFRNRISYTYNYGVKVASITEKEIIAIPPHSGKSFYEYKIDTSIHQECGLISSPKKESETFVYTKTSSPIVFRNIISYRKGNGESRIIDNEFYISEIKNVSGSSFAEQKILETKCKGQKKEESVTIYNYKSPDKFYIPYTPSYYTNWAY